MQATVKSSSHQFGAPPPGLLSSKPFSMPQVASQDTAPASAQQVALFATCLYHLLSVVISCILSLGVVNGQSYHLPVIHSDLLSLQDEK